MKTLMILLVALLVAAPAFAQQEGYDAERGDPVHIEGDNETDREGQIDFYDYRDGRHHTGTINTSLDEGEQLNIYDKTTGESRTIDTD